MRYNLENAANCVEVWARPIINGPPVYNVWATVVVFAVVSLIIWRVL